MAKDTGRNRAKETGGKYKADKAVRSPEFKPGQESRNASGGFSMEGGYKGSNLAKNHKPGKSHSSLYKGSNLNKNYANGYSYTTGYKGNKLSVSEMTSHVEGV